MNIFQRILREPLFQFLILGACLFVLYALVTPQTTNRSDVLQVTAAQQEKLASQFEGVWKRQPTEDETNALIEDFLREEVLYREAVALGLDQNDTVVRRRLRQKMEFFAESGAALLKPTDEDLAELLAAEPQKYRAPDMVAFKQVYLGDNASEEYAITTLAQLLAIGDGEEYAETGKSIMLPPQMELTALPGIERVFGPDFSQALASMETGNWQGPVRSAYGLHLVLIVETRNAAMPEVDEAREVLRRDWQHAKTIEIKNAQYQGLLDRYAVEIEEAATE